ncbi:MAG: sulfatase [Saprospiraceae bacterium]
MRYTIFLLGFVLFSCQGGPTSTNTQQKKRPNILFAISDDQSYPYTSIYGDQSIQTPAFDRIAQMGVLFNNAFCAAPQCSPSRAAILTGKNIWQLEEAGTHSSYFPNKFTVFTDVLEASGYELGYTGKPWGPGNWKDAGWDRNPVGPAYEDVSYEEAPSTGISKKNYAANFKAFFEKKPADRPFFFWFGCHEPHRVFEEGSGLKAGKSLEKANVPSFLPNDELVQSDLLDYAFEIEWFDQHLGEMLALLEAAGELENTIVVITADNGMAFPYAKANLQEYGTHVPLAIAGPSIEGGRKVDDLVSLIDLAPTFLEWTNTTPFQGITGKSLMNILMAKTEGIVDESRKMVLTGRERHTHARPDNLGYPARAIRTADYLYIQNFKPDRWPAGDPAVPLAEGQASAEDLKSMQGGYHDIDNSPSKSHITADSTAFPNYFQLAVGKRPTEELFDIKKDPGCTQNLAKEESLKAIKETLKSELMTQLAMQGDPRVLGDGDIFESYPRFASMRAFAGFRERGAYNPKYGKEALEVVKVKD